MNSGDCLPRRTVRSGQNKVADCYEGLMISAMGSGGKYFANPNPGHSQYSKYVFLMYFYKPSPQQNLVSLLKEKLAGHG